MERAIVDADKNTWIAGGVNSYRQGDPSRGILGVPENDDSGQERELEHERMYEACDEERMARELEGKRRLYTDLLAEVSGKNESAEMIVVLLRLGHSAVYVKEGGKLSLADAIDRGYKGNIFGMYQRVIAGLADLVVNPEKDSKLSRRALQASKNH